MNDKTYVLFGQSLLMVGVARALSGLGHRVLVLHQEEPSEETLELLPDGVEARRCSPRSEEFKLALQGCDCLLTLEEDDRDNLRLAVRAHLVAPEVPVVTRTFDPAVAEALEEGVNVRRAYSLSTISAAAFVTAFLEEELLASMPWRRADHCLPIDGGLRQPPRGSLARGARATL